MTPSPRSRRAAVLAPVLGLLLVGTLAPADAAGAVVSVRDFSFTPATVAVAPGQSVTWEFGSLHTTTSDQRFWDSGDRGAGASYAVAFRDAGTFGYHCTMHPSMTGRVVVPVTATGSAATGWRLRWSVRSSTPSNRRFDVRVKRVGATTWTVFRKATAKRAGLFNPSGRGSYLVRARTRNVGVGASGWSPALTVSIS